MLVPTLPGEVVKDSQHLKHVVSQLCGLPHTRFPGSQPVSFKTTDMDRLEHEDYWVCEKSDGIRVLLFIQSFPDGTQNIFLIDRKNSYRRIQGLYFPHYENKALPLRSTIMDGELVIDRDPVRRTDTLRYLAFDCLVFDGASVMEKKLDKRYWRLKEQVIRPHQRMIQELPHMLAGRAFDLQAKSMQLSYSVEQVIKVDIPRLQHGTDGLVYTPVDSPYVPGTDDKLLKWKSPSENSIDFKLALRFPPLSNSPFQPDYTAKPMFLLHTFHGEGPRGSGSKYEFFDIMDIEDEDWEKMKASSAQFDDRIVEASWDIPTQKWRFLRFRDDKEHGNHISVVHAIIDSIQDGVEMDAILARAPDVKVAWKARAGQPPPAASAQAPTHPSQGPPQPKRQQSSLPPFPSRLRIPPPYRGREFSKVAGPSKVGRFYR